MAEKLDPRQELATFDELLRGMTSDKGSSLDN